MNLVDRCIARFTVATAGVVAFFSVAFKRLQRPSRRRTVIIGVVAVLSVSTAAFGYWSTTGSGAASGTASVAQALTLTPATPTTQLYPGGQADVALTISNPNTFTVRVSLLSLDTTQGGGTGFAVDAGHSGCGVSSLSFVAQSNAGMGWNVPPTVSPAVYSVAVTLVGALSMSVGAADVCRGATFTVYLNATPDYNASIMASSNLVGYWHLGDNPTVADSFTGTAGTALTAHTGEVGASWTHHLGASNSVLSYENRVRKNGTGGYSLEYASTTPSSADYAVEAGLYVKSNVAGDRLGVVGRMDTSNALGTYYLARFNLVDNGWTLAKLVNGVSTALGSWGGQGALAVGQTYRVRLNMTGTSTTSLKVYVDGVERITATDSSSPLTAAGKAGILDGEVGSTATKTNATGLHADDFRVVANTGTAVTDSKGANNGTFSGSPLLNEPGAPAADFNRAVRWNGSSTYASIPDANPLDLLDGPFTLETWVRRADSSPARQTILHKGAGSFQWAFDGNSMALFMDGGTQIAKTTTTQTDTTAFHHYAVTKNGSAVKLYVDGVDVTGAVTDQQLANTSTALFMGSKGGTADFLNGVQDEVAVYNAVLSQSTIASHYHIGNGA